MTFNQAQQIERAFYALPKDVRARRAFVAALTLAGHKCTYWDRENGDRVSAFRMFNDDGNRFPEEKVN